MTVSSSLFIGPFRYAASLEIVPLLTF